MANAETATGNSTNYWVFSNPTDRIGMYVKGTGKLEVYWGDGTTAEYTLSGGAQAISYTYGSTATRGVVMIGNVSYIESNIEGGIGGAGATSFGGDITTMSTLTYIGVFGSNTVTGDISKLTGLTHLEATGSNTLYGSLSNLTSLNYISIQGSNKISGSVTNLTSVTTLLLQGNNTVSGDISNMALTYLTIAGQNTVTGSLANCAASITNINIAGNNTVSGSITGFTHLQYLILQGNNTVSGSVTAMTSMSQLMVTHGSVTGSIAGMLSLQYLYQTVAGLDYSAVNWNSLPLLCYVIPYGLTSAQQDAVLAALWANKDVSKAGPAQWYSTLRVIDLHNGTAQTPSGAGYTNKTSLQGYRTPNNSALYSLWTVTTN